MRKFSSLKVSHSIHKDIKDDWLYREAHKWGIIYVVGVDECSSLCKPWRWWLYFVASDDEEIWNILLVMKNHLEFLVAEATDIN